MSLVTKAVRAQLRLQSRQVPVGISMRHIHLSRREVDALFGRTYQLTPLRPLSQPGQFACQECLDVIGPRGVLHKVRILGPERPEAQVELAQTDCRVIGVQAPVRTSGHVEGTPGVLLQGPRGVFSLPRGVIVADRHLHMSTAQAAAFGLSDGDTVRVRVRAASRASWTGFWSGRESGTSWTCTWTPTTPTPSSSDRASWSLCWNDQYCCKKEEQAMILGTVKGTVYSTRKMEQLVGYKFLLVEPMYGSKKELIVAGDRLGAGIGELVMVTTDETVQHGLDAPAPMDAFIVGIVDQPPAIGK